MNISVQMIVRRADDQDARLAQRLAEEAEDAQAVDVADDLPVNLPISPVAASHSRGIAEPFVHHLITRICGWVASSVCVKT